MGSLGRLIKEFWSHVVYISVIIWLVYFLMENQRVMLEMDQSLKSRELDIQALKLENSKQAQHESEELSASISKIQLLNTKIKHLSDPDESQQFTKKNMTFFLHFHKAGGTTICQLAKMAGIHANFKKNCNVLPDQHCCGRTVEDQRSFVYEYSDKYDLVASERGLEDEVDFEYFNYVTILRHPFLRAQSHYNFVKDYYFGRPKNYIIFSEPLKRLNKMDEFEKVKLAKKMRVNITRLPDIAANMLKPLKTEMTTFGTWLKCQQDNYFTRMMCGRKCSQIVRGGLNKEHLQVAKSRLAKFDAVLILENFEESLLSLTHKMGWDFRRMGEKSKVFNAGSGKGSDYQDVIESSRELRQLFTLDLELYRYAMYLNQRQIEEVVYRPKFGRLSHFCKKFNESSLEVGGDSPRSCCCEKCSFW